MLVWVVVTTAAHGEPIMVRQEVGGRFGYLTGDLEVMISPKYEWASEFGDDFAVVRAVGESHFLIIDRTGSEMATIEAERVSAPSDGMVRARVDGSWGYFNTSGALRLHGYSLAGDFSEGFAFVKSDSRKTGFYIDKDGRRVFGSSAFELGGEFVGGEAVVQVEREGGAGNYYGVIDRGGSFVIEPEFSFLGELSGGYRVAGVGFRRYTGAPQQYGYVTRRGEWAINPEYFGAYPISEGRGLVRYQDFEGQPLPNHYMIISADGSAVSVLPSATRVHSGFRQGLAAISLPQEDVGTTLIGFMDETGELVIRPFIYRDDFRYASGYWLGRARLNDGRTEMVLVDPDTYRVRTVSSLIE